MRKRKRQKGVVCSVDGCTDWCTGNDLCAKHNMAVHRYRSVEGKAVVIRGCKGKGCWKQVKSKRDDAEYCSDKCRNNRPEVRAARTKAVAEWRLRNLEKARRRDSLDKRTKRRFPVVEACAVDGCDIDGERHHPDYDKPYEIVWLCREHHGEVHGLNIQFTVDEIRVDEVWKAAHLMNVQKMQSDRVR